MNNNESATMKSKRKNPNGLEFIFGALLQLYWQGYVLPNGVTNVGPSPGLSGYGTPVTADPTHGEFLWRGK